MSDETQEYHEVEEVNSNPVTAVIEQALVKANITDAILAELKQRFGSLTINGQDDRDGYRAVKEARLECKNWRVMAQKICKNGRAEALQIQKAWVKKETEITEKIAEVEDRLQLEEDKYNEEKERIKREEREKQEQRTMVRTAQLNKFGATFDGVNFVLGSAVVEGAIVREVDDQMYSSDILPMFQKIFEQNEQERREAAERERQQKEANDKAIKELEERREKERLEREQKEKEEREAAEKIYNERVDQLSEMQFVFVKKENRFKCYHFLIDDASVKSASPDEWNNVIALATEEIAKGREQAEAQKAEEEKQRAEKERLKALGAIRAAELRAFLPTSVDVMPEDAAAWSEEDYQENLKNAKYQHDKRQREKFEREQQEKKDREEKERQEQEAQKSDTAKWNEYIAHVLGKPIPEFRSGWYRKRSVQLRALVEQIKAL